MKLNFATLFTAFTALVLFETGCSKNTSVQQNNTDSEQTAWKVIGPGGGGGVLKPTISPFDENFVMTHCDMTAAYVSLDGGGNWSMKNLWNVPEDFEFDPVDVNIVYAATRGFRHSEDRGSGLSILYRSTDKGKSWEIVYPDVSKAKDGLENLQNYDYLPSEIIDGAMDGTIEKIAVDPSDNKKIYLGLAPLKFYMSRNNTNENPDSAMLVLSENSGKNWDLITKLAGKNIRAIFPASECLLKDEILVFTENACFRVNETTGKMKQLKLPVNNLIAVEGGTGANGNLVYIQSAFKNENGKFEGGMFVTSDQGESWTQINTGITEQVAEGTVPAFRKGLGVCETQPETAYISFTSPEKNSEGEVEHIYSIYKTTNAGKKWKPVLRSSTPGGYITNNFEGSWMEESFDPGWGGAPIDLGVAPGNPDVCFAGDNGRGYKTLDGGKTWKQTYSHNMPDGSYASGGLDVTTCYGVHFDPFDEEHFFICYTDMGLFHTFNGGESWFHSLTNVPRQWQNTCYDLKFDPEVKDKVWSVWGNAHDLPREKMFGPYGFDRYSGGVAVSADGGQTWEKSNQGMPENSVCTNVLVDPTTPAGSRTLYVTVFDKGVYKSTDDGQNWEEATNGLGDNLFAWQIRRNAKGRLFVLCSRGERNGEKVGGVIYYSDDEAATWKPLNLPEGVNGPHDLLIDEENGNTMYLSCWPRKTEDGDKNGGVYKTEDGSKTWKQVFDERIRVNSAALDPENSDIVYINTFQNAAYRSEDAGENWERIKGYRFKWGQRPVPDPNNPGMLFLTTYGGSVFYGPAKGVENEKQVIKNMPENWW
jgi:photosystem II stability/assembly factor-like uncharacterized protein